MDNDHKILLTHLLYKTMEKSTARVEFLKKFSISSKLSDESGSGSGFDLKYIPLLCNIILRRLQQLIYEESISSTLYVNKETVVMMTLNFSLLI